MALTIGLLATIVGGGVYALGLLDRLNGFNLDLHFRHLNTIEADPRIVLIDIDDSTLRVMPDWPWPRRVFAELVQTLHEMGAEAIVLDIVFAEPSKPRMEHAAIGKHYDIDTAFAELGDQARDEVIYDDDELRVTIRRVGNVYLPLYGDVRPPGMSPAHRGHQTTVRRFLRENPNGTWEQFRRLILPKEPADAQTPERESLLLAFRHALSMRAIDAKLSLSETDAQSVFPVLVNATPPLEKFAEAAKGVGLVSFWRNSSEGTIRRLPLLVSDEGVLLPQLGVLVAVDRMFSPLEVRVRGSQWTFGPRSYGISVEKDGDGASLVNWHRPHGGDWRSAFTHVPAAWILEDLGLKRAIAENEHRAVLYRAELVRERHSQTPAAYTEYVHKVNARHYLSSPRPRPALLTLEKSANGRYSNPYIDEAGKDYVTAMNNLTASIESTERESVTWVQWAWGQWRDVKPETDEEAAERDRIGTLHDRFGEGQYLDTLKRANERLDQRMRERDENSPKIDWRGKICLVGYTATAMADMVPTPVDPAMPGVMVHANVINMFLQNRFASEASRGIGLAILFLAGLVTTLTSTLRGTRFSVICLFVIASVMLGLGAVFFWLRTYHFPSLVTVVVVILVWASVTAYRQATEERARRAFQRALSQYTSPAVAARIAERTQAADLAPQLAIVSCFYSDLADFTRLSERLGPLATRRLLEPYLAGVSSALLDHGAMVNKFMGDGVFAFFNAPILRCPQHARAACEAALASLAAVGRCNAGREGGAMPVLTVRIGLSTGEAFVGDYGSDMKLDYTCIGDTVNLGSRLERANKAFGTAILVDDPTRIAAGDGFLFRSLGRIQVVGRTAPVAVHELIGKVGGTEEPIHRYIETFDKAVSSFQHCEWDSCLTLLSECRTLRPDDRAVGIYEQAVTLRRNALGDATQSGVIRIDEL